MGRREKMTRWEEINRELKEGQYNVIRTSFFFIFGG
jgi:hypothetical protein